MSDANTIRALQKNLADAEVERLRLVERIATLESDAQMLSDDDDACHRLLDKALDEGSLTTTSMETLLERLPRLIAKVDAAEKTVGDVFENLDLDSLRAGAAAREREACAQTAEAELDILTGPPTSIMQLGSIRARIKGMAAAIRARGGK